MHIKAIFGKFCSLLPILECHKSDYTMHLLVCFWLYFCTLLSVCVHYLYLKMKSVGIKFLQDKISGLLILSPFHQHRSLFIVSILNVQYRFLCNAFRTSSYTFEIGDATTTTFVNV